MSAPENDVKYAEAQRQLSNVMRFMTAHYGAAVALEVAMSRAAQRTTLTAGYGGEDPIASPAPQTESGDAEEIARTISESFPKWAISGPGSLVHVYNAIAPLAKRIAELENCDLVRDFQDMRKRAEAAEKENERLLALLKESVAQELPRLEEIQLHAKLAAAEARVNDLEQKLAGALKVTTENTIQHMTGKIPLHPVESGCYEAQWIRREDFNRVCQSLHYLLHLRLGDLKTVEEVLGEPKTVGEVLYEKEWERWMEIHQLLE